MRGHAAGRLERSRIELPPGEKRRVANRATPARTTAVWAPTNPASTPQTAVSAAMLALPLIRQGGESSRDLFGLKPLETVGGEHRVEHCNAGDQSELNRDHREQSRCSRPYKQERHWPADAQDATDVENSLRAVSCDESRARRDPRSPPRHGKPKARPYCHALNPNSLSKSTAVEARSP